MLSEKYKIDRKEDSIVPEETLADALSGHRSFERPVSHNVFRVFYIVILCVVLFFIARAFQLQIMHGREFAVLADRSRLYEYSVPSLRGIIYDAKGTPLTGNIPAFDVIATPSQLENKEDAITDISSILHKEAGAIRDIFDKNKDNAVVIIERDIGKEAAIALQGSRIKGIHIVPYSKRYYPLGRYAAHLIGYTAFAAKEELASSSYYLSSDRIGRVGLESYYENYLRGEHRIYNLDEERSANSRNFASGSNIYTTIDADMQEYLYKSMSDVFKEYGMQKGTAIVQDPKTGAVKAMVSLPSFDPNVFEDVSDPLNAKRIRYILNSNLMPLFNRAVGGLYSPGSTIKPLLALVGLKEGVVDENTLVYSEGYIEVQSKTDPSTVYTFKDWKKHGWTDIRKAIADSVDVYFYALGGGYGEIEGLGIAKIHKYLTSFLADKILGIDLPQEARGVVPSREWKKEVKNEPWFIGDTYNVSIGQGDLAVTPLWLNSYTGAVANGGNFMKPYIVSRITEQDGSTIEDIKPERLFVMPFSKEDMEIVRSGMRQTITDGTGKRLRDIPVPLAGKTGTAQVSRKELNSLFTVFGPYNNPKIVMTVIVENIGTEQSMAMRVAHDFLMWYFSRQ